MSRGHGPAPRPRRSSPGRDDLQGCDIRKGGRPRRPPCASLGLHDPSPYRALLDATASTRRFGRAPFGRGHSPTSALLSHVRPPCFQYAARLISGRACRAVNRGASRPWISRRNWDGAVPTGWNHDDTTWRRLSHERFTTTVIVRPSSVGRRSWSNGGTGRRSSLASGVRAGSVTAKDAALTTPKTRRAVRFAPEKIH